MLAGITVTLVIFFAVRYVAFLCDERPAISNAAGTLAVLLFLSGIWTGAALFGAAPAPQPLAVAPAPAVPANSAVAGGNSAPVSHALMAPGSPILASIDGITNDSRSMQVPAPNAFALGSTIFVNGWASSSKRARLKRLVFVFDHHIEYDGTAYYGFTRPDVAKAFNAPAMLPTGYNAVPLSTVGLGKGPHVLQVGGIINGSQYYHLAPTSILFTLQ